MAYDHIKAVDTDDHKDARAHAVKNGQGGIVAALDAAEKEILARPAECRHKCGIKITFGQQKVGLSGALVLCCYGHVSQHPESKTLL